MLICLKIKSEDDIKKRPQGKFHHRHMISDDFSQPECHVLLKFSKFVSHFLKSIKKKVESQNVIIHTTELLYLYISYCNNTLLQY